MSWYSSARRALPRMLACVLAVAQFGPTSGFLTHVDAATRSAAPLATACAPAPLGPASPYNAFILGNATQSGSDTEGLVAVGGNATLTDYAIGTAFSATVPYTTVLTVGGSLAFTRGALLGDATYGTTSTVSQSSVSGTVRQSSSIDFAATSRSLLALADYYGTLKANGITVYNPGDGNYNLASGAKGLTVFAITGTIPTPGIFRITGNDDGQGDQTFLINVSGASNQLLNLGFAVTGISPSHILFNFQATTSLTISGNYVAASVLAPRAAVDFTNAALEGTLIAGSLSGLRQSNSGQLNLGQLNQPPFNGCLPFPTVGSSPPSVPTTTVPSSTPRATTTAGTAVASMGTATFAPATTATPTATTTATPTTTGLATVVNTPTGGGVTAGTVHAPTTTPTPIKAGVTRSHTKTYTKVKYVTKIVTKTRTVIVYKTITRYRYITITHTVTKVKVRNIVNHKTVVVYKTVVKPVTKVTYRVVTVVHHVTKVQEVRALRIVRQPVTGRFGGPQQTWRGVTPPVEARISIARLGIAWASVWARDFIQTGWNAFTYDIVPQYGVTRFSLSARFGQPGLSMLSGHDDIYGSIFKNLDWMRPDDAIVVTQGPHLYRYVVQSVHVVTPDDVAMLNAPYARPTLALISCTPYNVDTHRVVVIARMQG